MLPFKIKYFSKNTIKVSTPNKGDIGFDLFANESLFILKGDAALISTGIGIELPEGYWMQLIDRSSVSKYCHIMAGVVDSYYRGEVLIRMYCHTAALGLSFPPQSNCKQPETKGGYLIRPGMKVAQGLIRKDYSQDFEVIEVDSLSETARGVKGFGSTGS